MSPRAELPTPQRLFDLPHADAKRALATGAPVYLLVNPVEYHGPHLSLHNDKVIAYGLARRLHASLHQTHPSWPFLLGDDLEIGVDPCPGPGTRHTSFAVASSLVVEACRALLELGARRVVFMTFHGSPLHAATLEAGVETFRARGAAAYSPFNHVLAILARMEDPTPFAASVASAPAGDRQRLLDKIPYDFHAGFFETSVALALAPETVSPLYRELPPCPTIVGDPRFRRLARAARRVGQAGFARECELVAGALGWNALRPFPGYTSEPAFASAEAGEAFVELLLDLYRAQADEVLSRGALSPPPVLSWTRTLSLDGRFEAAPKPGPGDVLRVGA